MSDDNYERNVALIKAMLPSPEKTAQIEQIWQSGIIEWHEPNRHGVIRNVPRNLLDIITEAIVYYMGSNGIWEQKNQDRTYNLEFVHMAKVFPPPKKPWEWCGETILFKDWHSREQRNRQLIHQFSIGDEVEFEYNDETHRGIVSGMRKRLTIIVGHSKYYMPASYVRKVK